MLDTGICKGDPRDALRPRMTIKKKAPEHNREETPGSSPRVTVVKKSPNMTVIKKESEHDREKNESENDVSLPVTTGFVFLFVMLGFNPGI